MAIDLQSMSSKELQDLISDAKKELAKAQTRDRREALKAAERAAEEYGFSLNDLTDGAKSGARKGGGKSQSAPQFANPADPSQTWTGKGRQPNWYRAEMEKGTSPDDLRI